jgi:hypothetical protein
MQPIIHFTLSLLVGAMMARNQRHPAIFALACGALGVLPDVDHFITSPALADSWMHNGYLLVVAPMMLFAAAFVFDNARPERHANAQMLALAFLAILSGHMALDIAAGNALPVAYPVETGTFETAQTVLLYAGDQPFVAVSDVPLACWAAFCMVAFIFTRRMTYDASVREENSEPGLSLGERFYLGLTRPKSDDGIFNR